MAQGVSIHIGLNHVDPKHYQGWDGALNACVADAKDMCALAKKKGFTGNTLLLNEQATAAAVTAALQDASKKLGKGDILFLTYSGHGGQVRDTNADEKDNDRMDETWVLFDREFVDDELYNLWSKFKPGVRILVLSDSCHSGTVTRDIPIFVGGGPLAGVRLHGQPNLYGWRSQRCLHRHLEESLEQWPLCRGLSQVPRQDRLTDAVQSNAELLLCRRGKFVIRNSDTVQHLTPEGIE